MMDNGNGEILGALIVPVYTFFIAMELWRERRRTRYSRAAAIVVPCLHAGIYLVPLAMRVFLPDGHEGVADLVFVFLLQARQPTHDKYARCPCDCRWS